MNTTNQKRIKKLIQLSTRRQVEALFVTNPVNIYYLTGIKSISKNDREFTLVVSSDKTILFCPRMYEIEVSKNTSKYINVEIVDKGRELFTKPRKILQDYNDVGIESANLKVHEFQFLEEELKQLIPIRNVIEQLRMKKDHHEIESIKKAVSVTDKVMKDIINMKLVGKKEVEISDLIKSLFEEFDSEGVAFDPIVASGRNSAMPHHQPTDSIINKGILLLDIGGMIDNYSGDLTRTIYLGGHNDKKFSQIYRKVSTTQQAVIDSIAPGIKCSELYDIAMQKLGDGKEYMNHSLGHGIGLDIHEEPHLSTNVEIKLQQDMVFTVEPGIYLSDWGGVRIEDVVRVTKTGVEVLSKTTK